MFFDRLSSIITDIVFEGFMMKQHLQRLQNWCFPPTCVLTNLLGLVNLDLSDEVIQGFQYQTKVCPVCGEKSYKELLCGACLSKTPSFDRTQAFYDFDGELRELIHLYKFQKQHFISSLLAKLMLDNLDTSQVEVILAVPLHTARLRARGFNQSLEIAKIISKRTKLPLILHGVERTKATMSQTQLSAPARQQNLKGAFKVNSKYFASFEKIAVIDDVITTGATMEAISKQIKKQTNVKTIDAWAVAKTR